MGNYAYILVAGFVVAGSVLMLGTREDNKKADMSLANVVFKEEAREAALTGMQLTLRRLVADEDTTWGSVTSFALPLTDFRNSQFQTFVTRHGADTVDIESIGMKDFAPSPGPDTTHTVQVRIIRIMLDDGIPDALKKALFVNMDLKLGGNIYLKSYDGVSNASLHTNGQLTARSANFLVQGYGTYTTEPVNVSPNAEESFQPLQDEGYPGPVAYEDSLLLPIPNIDQLRTESQAYGVYLTEDAIVDLTSITYATFGEWAAALGLPSGVGTTPDHPFVYFSEGTLDFTGALNIGGYGIWVANGNLRINSGTQLHGGIDLDENGEPNTQMAIIQGLPSDEGGTVNINGTTDITATIYGAGSAKLNGTATIVGGLIVDEFGGMSGTLDITWAGPNSGFEERFYPDPPLYGPIIASWAEW